MRALLAAAFVVVGLLALSVGPPARLHASAHASPTIPATKTRALAPTSTTTVPGRGITLDASWPKTLTLVTDSVTLGARSALGAALPGWHIEVLGRPALMVKQAAPEYLPPGKRVGSVVVIGLGYNSLWEKNRAHFGAWAAQFDREADSLIAELRSRGAEKIVWVTVREPSLRVVTADSQWQYEHYAWFFPYVNERLHALAKRQPDIALADWAAVSDRTGLTYDLMHLDPAGARLMAKTIATAVRG